MSIEREILQAFLAAFATSALLTLWVLRVTLRRRIMMDAPNDRSSHAQPKPRGGGLGVIGGFAAGCALAFGWRRFDDASLLLLAGALVCAALGVWDDVYGLSVWPRLAAETAMAVWFVSETGPLIRLPLPAPLDIPLGIFGFVFPVVWLVGVTNFFNFMDGIDGLAAGQAIAVCLAVAAASWYGVASGLALALTGALLGFLPFNWWPSRIFLGDVGSLPVGFLIAGFALLAPAEDRHKAVLLTATSLTLFLLDPVQTLWKRWRRGARLGQSHREHLYQQLLRPGDPHSPVTSSLLLACFGLSAVAWAAYKWPSLGWPGVVLAAFVYGGEHLLARRRAGR